MKNYLPVSLLMVTLSAFAVQANDVAKPKGPAEDGTLPALVKIAGEGTMDSTPSSTSPNSAMKSAPASPALPPRRTPSTGASPR